MKNPTTFVFYHGPQVKIREAVGAGPIDGGSVIVIEGAPDGEKLGFTLTAAKALLVDLAVAIETLIENEGDEDENRPFEIS